MHKIIIVGQSGVGKTALTLRYMYGDFVDCLGYDFDPTFSYRKRISVDSNSYYEIDILDTTGYEEKEKIYQTGEGFMCVYSIDMKKSFEKIENIFNEILQEKDGKFVPFILVENKVDIEEDRKVDVNRGKELAEKFDCPFIETSAKLDKNVKNAFDLLVKMVIDHKINSPEEIEENKQKRSKCIIN